MKSPGATLEFASQWFATRAAGLSKQELRCTYAATYGGRRTGQSNIYSKVMWGALHYKVEITRCTLKCKTPFTMNLDEAIKWQADVLHFFDEWS